MSNKNKNRNGIVFSTDPGFSYEGGEDNAEGPVPASKQNLKIHLEKNSRGGKTVSIVRGFIGSDDEMDKLCSDLKKHCGVGGSSKDGEILIQGDFRDKIMAYLLKAGYKAKKAGA